MVEPLTEELLGELLDAPDPMRFVEDHGITQRSLPEYLAQLLDEKGLSRPAVIRDAGLNATYGYQIFTGARKASRDYILQIAFAMHCTLKETNRMLQAAGLSALYCKDRRDAIIIFCIDRGMTLLRVNEELYRFGEGTIGAA